MGQRPLRRAEGGDAHSGDTGQTLSRTLSVLGTDGAVRSTLRSAVCFNVREDEIEGGYIASALGFGIHTQGETIEELRERVKEAVDCYFDGTMEGPKVIRLHFVRER